ncbi:MAG TPA: MarP family serine protease [Candidatus Saccharimonadales bacterium]|nr:MarP family serine protease [Candidatus Saccharimonadales bacterium]
MDLIDILIILTVVAAGVRGHQAGFFREGLSFGGFILGIIIGAAVAPYVAHFGSTPLTKSLLTFATVVLSAAVLGGIGETVGFRIADLFKQIHLRWFDQGGGIVMGACVALLSAWIVGNMFSSSPFVALNSELQRSVILQGLNKELHPPTALIARIKGEFQVDGFPQVFTGLEPIAPGPVQELGQGPVTMAAKLDEASVVKIVGAGCGGIKEGTGFIAANNLVMTNAHVVAGIAHPEIVDQSGSHTTTVVLYDPNLDIAILRTSGLTGKPLSLHNSIAGRGQQGVVLGYPEDGPYTADAAAVLEKLTAEGQNIYDSQEVTRDVYSLQTTIKPGNSGGPLVGTDGSVWGVVFASSSTDSSIGYALTSQETLYDLNQAIGRYDPVSTQACNQ